MTERRHSAAILPSWPLALVLGVLMIAGVLLGALYLPAWLAVVFGAVVLMWGIRVILTQALGMLRDSIVALRFGPEGLELQRVDGHWGLAGGVRGSFVHPLLTIISIRGNSGAWMRHHLVVVPGRMEEDDFRWLRVWLRWRNADLDEGLSQRVG